MRVKTNELIGAALDWAVATASGIEPEICDIFQYGRPNGKHYISIGETDRDGAEVEFAPSTEGDAVIDLMERERISVRTYAVPGHNWVAFQDFGGSSVSGVKARMTGPTSRIAVCRCYVAANLGDEVEIPEELLDTHNEGTR